MTNRWQHLVVAALLCANLNAVQVFASPAETRAADETITLDASALSLVRKTNAWMQSFTLDTSYIQNRWVDTHISSEKFLKLASHLGPAYLRIGGTDSDSMLFNETYSPDSGEPRQLPAYSVPTFYVSGKEWLQINQFAKKSGLTILLCLNALHRSGSVWDPSNAKELLDFSDKHGLDFNFQLGNEPDLFPYVFNNSLTGAQHGEDFNVLRSVLNTYPRYKNSLLVGPDIYMFTNYLHDFLSTQKNAISAVSFHHYYVDGTTAKVEDFYNPKNLNGLVSYINTYKEIITNTSTKVPVWLSETSSSMKGGAANIADRFVAGFMWLDKLAIAPKLGVDVVCRQDLYGNKYGLLNIDTLEPNPDWWLSVLYKKLVGVGVLNTTIPTGSVRLYAHCSKTSPGSVVLFGMNVDSKQAKVQVKGSVAGLETGQVSAYILTGETGLLSQTVLLNGRRLELGANYSLPELEPVTVAASPLNLPAFSLAFFVLHDVQVSACKEK